jgi:hypothetical protein
VAVAVTEYVGENVGVTLDVAEPEADMDIVDTSLTDADTEGDSETVGDDEAVGGTNTMSEDGGDNSFAPAVPPIPSCPYWFEPQHLAPPFRIIQVCWYPPDTLVTPELTKNGVN